MIEIVSVMVEIVLVVVQIFLGERGYNFYGGLRFSREGFRLFLHVGVEIFWEGCRFFREIDIFSGGLANFLMC